jgi:hypothetical protein
MHISPSNDYRDMLTQFKGGGGKLANQLSNLLGGDSKKRQLFQNSQILQHGGGMQVTRKSLLNS